MLYFTRFETESELDVLTIDGHAYSGSSGSPQGSTSSGIILWSTSADTTAGGWQMCTANGLKRGENFAVLSGPCTSTAGCVQSPNFPSDYGNSELCEIMAPEKALYFTSFSTEGDHDVLTIDGQAYSGSSGPPQGSTSSGIILWNTSADTTASGWQMCTASGLKLGKERASVLELAQLESCFPTIKRVQESVTVSTMCKVYCRNQKLHTVDDKHFF